MPAGGRNTTLFVYGSFLARVTGVSGLAGALRRFAARVCDLDDGEIGQIAGSITKKLGEDGRGYRFTVANAAAALGVTAEEVKRAGLRRLWPADAELDAALKAAKRKRDRQYQRQRRQAAGARPREQSLARTQPGSRSACRGRATTAASTSRALASISSALRRIRRSQQVGGPWEGCETWPRLGAPAKAA